jgi:hypothetical protein
MHKSIKAEPTESLTKEDFFLVFASAIFTTFLIRLSIYANFSYNNAKISLIYFVIVIVSFSITLLLRKRTYYYFKIFKDMKFKLMYSAIVSVLNSFYVMIVFDRMEYLFVIPLIFGLVFFFCILCIIIVKPVAYVVRSLKKSHE